MLAPFDIISERLLRAGVGRRHSDRYLAELKDHFDDLIAEELQSTIYRKEAYSKAMIRLGSLDVLADAMISSRQFRAWTTRLPVTSYLIVPPFALIALMAVALASIVITSTWIKTVGIFSIIPLPLLSTLIAASVMFLTNFFLAILLGWVLGIAAIRQRSPAIWPSLGIVVLASVGAAVQVSVTLPSANMHGEIELLPSFGPSFSLWTRYIDHLAVDLVLTLVPYAVFKLRRVSL